MFKGYIRLKLFIKYSVLVCLKIHFHHSLDIINITKVYIDFFIRTY